VPAAGVTVVSIAAVGSEPSGDAGAPVVARLRSGEPSVRVRVGASDAGAYPVGAAVTVAAVADGTRRASGTVAAVGPFSPAPSDDGAPPGYDVTVLLPPEHPFTDGLEVTVDAADASVLEGLTVPLVAVREDPDGAYVLVPGDGDDREPRRVGVTVTGSADGYAVVTGDDLSAGRSVIISDGT
jgi:multidrug efflux pump subunit AcrA (membrane-fusion protein)